MENLTHKLPGNGEFYGRISPIEPLVLYILGSFLVLIMVLGLLFNTILLRIFIVNKDLRTPVNSLIIAITLLNLIGSLTELPWVIHSCFSNR